MSPLFPPLQPYQKYSLKVSPLHTLYFEESGNPQGKPLLFLHGGPGGGTEPLHRQLYDPTLFRIILVDQRGCGQSLPFAELEENTTWDLVEDLEKIRTHLQINTWFIHGGSWGSTLALAYAIKHADRVKGMVLRGIFLCTESELTWLYQKGVEAIFPEEWDKYKNFIPETDQSDMIGAYHRILTSGDEPLKLRAAQIWSQWESAVSKLIPDPAYIEKYENPHKALPFARIESHYFVNKAFFPSDDFIIENAKTLRQIPIHIVHGRYDMVCPVQNAWRLHRALPQSTLQIVPDAGHSVFEPNILSAVIEACQKMGEAIV